MSLKQFQLLSRSKQVQRRCMSTEAHGCGRKKSLSGSCGADSCPEPVEKRAPTSESDTKEERFLCANGIGSGGAVFDDRFGFRSVLVNRAMPRQCRMPAKPLTFHSLGPTSQFALLPKWRSPMATDTRTTAPKGRHSFASHKSHARDNMLGPTPNHNDIETRIYLST
jgi:hypothetical protein